VEAAVALVSCLVWRERGEGGAAVRPELQGPLAALRAAARRVGKARAHPAHAVRGWPAGDAQSDS